MLLHQKLGTVSVRESVVHLSTPPGEESREQRARRASVAADCFITTDHDVEIKQQQYQNSTLPSPLRTELSAELSYFTFRWVHWPLSLRTFGPGGRGCSIPSLIMVVGRWDQMRREYGREKSKEDTLAEIACGNCCCRFTQNFWPQEF